MYGEENNSYKERNYRKLFRGINLHFFDVTVFETDLCIGAEKILYNEALDAVKKYRGQIEAYIRMYPDFLTSLEPVPAMPGSSVIIQRMCSAAEKAGVGPMAAVAGAIAEMVGMELLKHSDEVIVENGGDIFIKTKEPRKIGIFAGKSPFSEKICLEISPEDTPLGVCTSSGTVGHSLSFGKADAAVIVAENAFLADAVATATGNRVKTWKDIEAAIEFASGIEGVKGVLVIIGNKMGAFGNIKLAPF